VKPLEDRIYVRREGGWSEETSDLIVVEDKPPLEVGLVEAVGPGRWQRVKKGSHMMERVPMEIEVGDRVLFDRYAGMDVEVGLDDTHTLLRQDEVLAVIDAQA
jgi:chaperonin GroES